MRPSSAITIAAATVVGLMFVKNGTAGNLIQNAATFLRTGAQGLRPLTNVT